MGQFQYDLFVIGAGSGGVRASRMSASMGAKVAVAEHGDLGGTCVNVGCVPKKLFVYGSEFSSNFADAAGFGWKVDAQAVHWPTLRDNKNREITRLNGIYGRLLNGAGVDIIDEHASLRSSHEIEVNGRTITSERILVATGSWPTIPQWRGREHAVTSNELFHLATLPRRALIVGGGYIAVEFAGIFAGLGVDVTLVYRGPLFLRGFDDDVRRFVAEELGKHRIHLKFETDIVGIAPRGGEYQVQLNNGEELTTDLVVAATGRHPNVAGLGLENLGVRLGAQGEILVNENYQTTNPSIYALGDVIGRAQLTPVAIAEAMTLSRQLFKGESEKLDYSAIPTAVFCQPNIGTVGLTESKARSQFAAIKVFETTFKPMKHTLSGRDERTYMKLIVDEASDRVVGVHMVGDAAGEIIQCLAVALRAGATKSDFDHTMGIHPTAAEEFVTLREPRRDLSPKN